MLDGSITLTNAALLRPCLSAENHHSVLREARGRTKREVEEIVARLRPRPDVPATIRRLPLAPAPEAVPPAPVPPPVAARVPETRPAPLAPDRYRYQVTIDAETRDLLAFAKELLSHAQADDMMLLKRALHLLVADSVRRKFAATDRPPVARRETKGPRHIPADVKRTVFIRDRGRCAFVGTHGHRCNDRAFLEFHHVKPYAAGGASTADNLQLRCKRHNGHEARLYFGRDADGSPRLQVTPALTSP